ncbi:MAG: hypothetical protein EOP84_14950 [Verrucomicrobiaceae bacterium]|nr:MAG: hypothetical protein EOP84_14950 [Verrucomicrobiaceae bacterium]
MKCVPPIVSCWSIVIPAALTVAGAFAWLSYPLSRPMVANVPAAKTSSLHSEDTPAAPPSEPPTIVRTPAIGDKTLKAEDVSKRKEIALKQRQLRTAMTEAARLPDSQRRNETLAHLCYQWAESDPRGALAHACSYHLDEGGILENLTMQWARDDLPAARAWLQAQPRGNIKARLIARISFLWAQTEPEIAANYIIDEMPPGEIQTEAAISVLHQWAQRNRSAATDWAMSFPPGELRERALREVTPVELSEPVY